MGYLPMILEKFIEAIVGLVVNFFPSLISNLPTEASARAELVKLTERAERIRARLADAEQNRQIENESVLLWLSELRSIAFDAEDLKEEFETRARVATRASHWAVLSSAWYYWCMLSRVDEINKKYDVIYRDRKATMLRECGEARVVSTTRRSGAHQTETGSLEGIRRLHGRHEESERLIRLLREPMNSGRFPPVLSIIGAGGMGKTALAQFAFNYPDIFYYPDITNRFEPIKIWSAKTNFNVEEVFFFIIQGYQHKGVLIHTKKEGVGVLRYQNQYPTTASIAVRRFKGILTIN